MTAVLRQPLLHFLLIGAALFGLHALLDDAPQPAARNVIAVTQADARTLAAVFATTWRRPPDAAELDRLIDDFVREEVRPRREHVGPAHGPRDRAARDTAAPSLRDPRAGGA